jgi:hypothetical protein
MKTLVEISVGEDILDMQGNKWRCVEKLDPSMAVMMKCENPILLARRDGWDILIAGYNENTLILGNLLNADKETRRLAPKDLGYNKYAKMVA